MKKVTFEENSILVNGEVVGHFGGSRGEVYVYLKSDEDHEGAPGVKRFDVAARFKYRSPKAAAKHWLKFILAIMTSGQILKALKPVPGVWPSESPLGLAEKQGYVCLNTIKALKEKAEQERKRNTPVTIVTDLYA